MMIVLVRIVVNAAALWLAATVVPGIELLGAGSTIAAALVLGLVNAILKPVLIVMTLPLTLLTLGLFIFVVNALCLWLTAAIVPGFVIHGFGAAFLGALLVSAVSWLLSAFARDAGHWKRTD